MNIRKRKCVIGPEDYEDANITLNFFESYSRESCLMECRATKLFNLCNCLPYYYPDFSEQLKDDTNCNQTELECLAKYTSQLLIPVYSPFWTANLNFLLISYFIFKFWESWFFFQIYRNTKQMSRKLRYMANEQGGQSGPQNFIFSISKTFVFLNIYILLLFLATLNALNPSQDFLANSDSVFISEDEQSDLVNGPQCNCPISCDDTEYGQVRKVKIIDPRGRPTVTTCSEHYFHSWCPSVRLFCPFKKSIKTIKTTFK